MSSKKKPLIHEFQTIYKRRIWIAIHRNYSEVIDGLFVDSNFNPIDISGLEECDGFTVKAVNSQTKKRGVLIVFESKRAMKAGVMAHEASHAAKAIFEDVGIDARYHEVFEYFLEWIVECCEIAKNHKTTLR